jgi:hypothetical protein
MKINPNANPLSVEGAQLPKPAAPASLPAADAPSFAGSAAVNSALSSTPDSRPEAVDRAKALINDSAYPGPEVLRKVSQLLASQIGSAND